MNRRWMNYVLLVLAFSLLLAIAACHKKQPAPVAPVTPPPPPQPTATLSASPETIQLGQGSTLTWSTQNATDVSIDGIGTVDASGSRRVTPDATTTYHLSAKGPGGGAEATARVTVTQPPPPPAPIKQISAEELFAQNIKDIYFDYDKFDLRPDDQAAIAGDASFLRQHSEIMFTIEGHCDERGSTDYNIALGDNRANAVKNALIAAGVSSNQIRTISYGKEKPFCTQSTEVCWQENRRGHFVYGQH